MALAKELCSYLSEAFAVLESSSEQIIATYKSCLYKLGETVRLKKESRVFDAMVKDVTSLGQLVVHHAIEERFSVGEVEWMI